MGVNEDFDRLNAASQQHAPHHQHHGPSPAAIAVIGGLAYLGAREYNYRQGVANGTIPVGWKRNVWGWYALVAAGLHFVIWLAWFANAYVNNPFGPMFWVIGTMIWLPTWFVVFVHQTKIREHNAALPLQN